MKSRAGSPADLLATYQEHDNSGRTSEITFQGRFIVTLWTDHAVEEARIVRVEKA